MNFSGIRQGDHVKYSRIVSKKLHEFPDAAAWDGDALNCLFYVERVSTEAVEFSCVDSCGCHNLETFTREEYQEYSNILGESLLRTSSVNEHLMSGPATDIAKGIRQLIGGVMVDTKFSNVVDEYECYDVDKDAENVLQLLRSQVQKKRM